MRDDSSLACRLLRGRCLGILPGLWLCVLGLAGCVDYGYPLAANAQQSRTGYKYFTLTRDRSGQYRNGSPTDPDDTAVYSYSFRYFDLVKINPDMEVAVRQIIETRNGVPPECTSGFHVEKIIRGEGGGVAANIECNPSDVKK